MRSLLVIAMVAGAASAAPFVPRDQRHFDHDRHVASLAKAGQPAAACTMCHDVTQNGEPKLVGKAEHNRCFAACHDHPFATSCGGLGPLGNQPCLVCHATVLSKCAPPGLVPQSPTKTFAAKFAHAIPGHATDALEADCALCHRTEAAGAAPGGTGHAECGACHTATAKPAMTDCAGCHGARAPHAGPATDPFRLGAFDHAAHTATARKNTCVTCHQRATGETLRPTMQGCQTRCHDGTRAFSTTGTTCTKCHHAADPPVAARTDLGFSHAEHERRHVKIADCTGCHLLEPDGTVQRAAKDHQPCAASGCHQTEFASRTTKICGTCHLTASPWVKPAARTGEPAVHEWFQTMNHATHLRAAGTANAACDGCHGEKLVGGAVPRGHRACASCHGAKQAPAMTECAACHARAAPAHAAASAWSVASSFQHKSHAADPRTGRPTACIACHASIAASRDLSSIGAPAMASCEGCHDGKLAFKATGFGCAKCHGAAR